MSTEPLSPSPATLRLTGLPALLPPGGEPVPLERKAAALLAWLALQGPASREQLASLLWPATGDTGRRNNLRQLLFKLKKAPGGPWIEEDGVLRLAASVVVAAAAADGGLLDGLDYADCSELAHWLAAQREALLQRHHTALLADAASAEAAGQHDLAALHARALLASDPAHEAAHRQLIRALYLQGLRSAALAACDACAQALRDQLDAPPSAETLALFERVRQAPAAPHAAASPLAVLRPPRLIGRERQARQLQATAEGHALLLLGEAGLGKSRLLQDALSGAEVLLVSARPGDAGVPFATLARLMRGLLERLPGLLNRAFGATVPSAVHHLLPELGSSAGADGKPRLDLQWMLTQLLAAAGGESVSHLVLDDLHFADDPSVELLHAVIGEESLARWRWTLARRPAEGSDVAARLQDELAESGRLQVVPLQPLTADEVAELVASLEIPGFEDPGLAAALTRTTGGNPMFLLEILKAMLAQPATSPEAMATRAGGDAVRPALAGLPRSASVGAAIERRLKQLSPQAMALARVAALAGPDFGTDLAVHVLGQPLLSLADAWAELESAQVLRDRAFAHDLIFEATLASVPKAIVRHVRRAIAEFLAPREGEPARLAAHWLAADEPRRAAPQFEAAARRAEAVSQFAPARQLLAKAADCWQAAGDAAAALSSRLALAELMRESGDAAGGLALLRELEATVSDIDERLRASVGLVKNLIGQGRGAEARQHAERLLASPEVLEDASPQRRAELRHAYADVLRTDGLYAEALAQLDLVREHYDDDTDPQRRGWLHSDLGIVLLYLGEPARAEGHFDTALACARRVGRQRMVAGVLQASANASQLIGRLHEPLERLEEARRLMVDSGGADLLSQVVQAQIGRELAYLARLREALEILEPYQAEDAPLPGLLRAQPPSMLAHCWAVMGQPERAAPLLRRAHAAAQATGSLMQIHAVLLVEIECAWIAGTPVAGLCDRLRQGVPDDHLMAYRADLLRWRDDPLAADADRLAWLHERMLAQGLIGLALQADLVGCRRAGAGGDRDAAIALAGRALKAARRCSVPGTYRAALWWQAWEGVRDADDGLAAAALRDGADWVRSVLRFQVPEAWRDSFVQRNRFNRELLAAAR